VQPTTTEFKLTDFLNYHFIAYLHWHGRPKLTCTPIRRDFVNTTVWSA